MDDELIDWLINWFNIRQSVSLSAGLPVYQSVNRPANQSFTQPAKRYHTLQSNSMTIFSIGQPVRQKSSRLVS